MSIKLANKFLENNKYNEGILRQYDRKSEQYELIPKVNNRRISSIFRAKERKVNLFIVDCITTMIIFYSAFLLGWVTCDKTFAYKEFDPMLSSLNSSTNSLLFSITYGLGALISSLSVNLFGRQISTALLLTIICVTQVLAFKSEWFAFAITSLEGLSSGALYVTLLVWIIDIWRDKSRPLLQSLFFVTSLATFLEPVVQKQYIYPDQFDCSHSLQNMSYLETIVSTLSHNNSINSYLTNTSLKEDIKNEEFSSENSCKQTHPSNIPQICTAFLAICGTAFLVILWDSHKQYIEKNKIRFKSRNSRKHRIFTKRFSIESLKSWKSSFFLATTTLLLISYLITEYSNVKLLSIYWNTFDTKINDSKLSFIRVAFFGTQSLFAGFFIIITMVLKPQIILILNFFVITVANLTLFLFGDNSYVIIIIVCTLMGSAFSSSLVAIYSTLEQYMHIDSTVGSIIVSISVILFTVILKTSEQLIDDTNILYYICMNFISIIIALLTLTLLWCSKFFINSEGFNLRTPDIQISPGNKSLEIKFKFEIEHSDSFGSDGSYQPRETSIVSI